MQQHLYKQCTADHAADAAQPTALLIATSCCPSYMQQMEFKLQMTSSSCTVKEAYSSFPPSGHLQAVLQLLGLQETLALTRLTISCKSLRS
jgi:hypothetical protein